MEEKTIDELKAIDWNLIRSIENLQADHRAILVEIEKKEQEKEPTKEA